MFSQASVILFTGGRVCVCGRHPPGQTPPGKHPQVDTPEVDTLLGRHPPWAHTPPQMATAADATRPTGMHSCSI